MLTAIALVVSYFSGPMLNFGDFARYGKSFAAVKKGNFLGLPVNFLVFSLLVVITAAATVPVFGELITDPVQTVPADRHAFAILLGALTFMIATVGINIVANFISPGVRLLQRQPAEDLLADGRHDRRRRLGAAHPVEPVQQPPPSTTRWPARRLIGPLFGVLIADYYLVQAADRGRRPVHPEPDGRYRYKNGYNPNAVMTMATTGVVAILLSLFTSIGDFGWFIGCGLGFAMFALLERTRPMIPVPTADAENVSDGTTA